MRRGIQKITLETRARMGDRRRPFFLAGPPTPEDPPHGGRTREERRTDRQLWRQGFRGEFDELSDWSSEEDDCDDESDDGEKDGDDESDGGEKDGDDESDGGEKNDDDESDGGEKDGDDESSDGGIVESDSEDGVETTEDNDVADKDVGGVKKD